MIVLSFANSGLSLYKKYLEWKRKREQEKRLNELFSIFMPDKGGSFLNEEPVQEKMPPCTPYNKRRIIPIHYTPMGAFIEWNAELKKILNNQ